MRAGLGIALSVLAAAGLVAPVARADEAEVRNQVSFSVERSREVENDWVTAVVGATHEDAATTWLNIQFNCAVFSVGNDNRRPFSYCDRFEYGQ